MARSYALITIACWLALGVAVAHAVDLPTQETGPLESSPALTNGSFSSDEDVAPSQVEEMSEAPDVDDLDTDEEAPEDISSERDRYEDYLTYDVPKEIANNKPADFDTSDARVLSGLPLLVGNIAPSSSAVANSGTAVAAEGCLMNFFCAVAAGTAVVIGGYLVYDSVTQDDQDVTLTPLPEPEPIIEPFKPGIPMLITDHSLGDPIEPTEQSVPNQDTENNPPLPQPIPDWSPLRETADGDNSTEEDHPVFDAPTLDAQMSDKEEGGDEESDVDDVETSDESESTTPAKELKQRCKKEAEDFLDELGTETQSKRERLLAQRLPQMSAGEIFDLVVGLRELANDLEEQATAAWIENDTDKYKALRESGFKFQSLARVAEADLEAQQRTGQFKTDSVVYLSDQTSVDPEVTGGTPGTAVKNTYDTWINNTSTEIDAVIVNVVPPDISEDDLHDLVDGATDQLLLIDRELAWARSQHRETAIGELEAAKSSWSRFYAELASNQPAPESTAAAEVRKLMNDVTNAPTREAQAEALDRLQDRLSDPNAEHVRAYELRELYDEFDDAQHELIALRFTDKDLETQLRWSQSLDAIDEVLQELEDAIALREFSSLGELTATPAAANLGTMP